MGENYCVIKSIQPFSRMRQRDRLRFPEIRVELSHRDWFGGNIF